MQYNWTVGGVAVQKFAFGKLALPTVMEVKFYILTILFTSVTPHSCKGKAWNYP
jgi:hypothetical protein